MEMLGEDGTDKLSSLGLQDMSCFGVFSAGDQVIAHRALQHSKKTCHDGAVWYCDTGMTSQRSYQQTCHRPSIEVFIIWACLPSWCCLFIAQKFQPCPFEKVLYAIRSLHSFISTGCSSFCISSLVLECSCIRCTINTPPVQKTCVCLPWEGEGDRKFIPGREGVSFLTQGARHLCRFELGSNW